MRYAFIAMSAAYVVSTALKGFLPAENWPAGFYVLLIVQSAAFGFFSPMEEQRYRRLRGGLSTVTRPVIHCAGVQLAALVAAQTLKILTNNGSVRVVIAAVATIAFLMGRKVGVVQMGRKVGVDVARTLVQDALATIALLMSPNRWFWRTEPPPKEPYDAFVSYKSQDATAVRKVVEQLIGRGARVWFAEHHILLTNFNKWDVAVARAIAHSRHAILFTNNTWAGSKSVRSEVTQILAWNKPLRVVEVRVPESSDGGTLENEQFFENEKFLDNLHWNIYGHSRSYRQLTLDDPDECYLLVERIMGFIGVSSGQAPPSRFGELMAHGVVVVHHGIGYAMNIGPFRPDAKLDRGLEDCAGGWTWPFNGCGETADGHLRMMAYVRLGRTAIGGAADSALAESDDRCVYDAYRKHAAKWVATGFLRWMPITAKGLHLIRTGQVVGAAPSRRALRTHFGLTYMTKTKNGMNSWERRYEYALPDPIGGSCMELDLIFWIRFCDGDLDDQFRQFCRITPLFDSIAESLVCRQELRQPFGPSRFVLE